jgi:hypothetical protein
MLPFLWQELRTNQHKTLIKCHVDISLILFLVQRKGLSTSTRHWADKCCVSNSEMEPLQAMKALGISPLILKLSTRWGCIDLYNSVSLHSALGLVVPMCKGLGGPHNRRGRFGKEKNPLILSRI